MLLDSASMYFRAFYGLPDRFTGRDGTPTNAVRGFLDAVARLVGEFHPDSLVACWDDDWRPQFRVDLIGSYKAHRVADADAATAADDGIEETPDALQQQVPVIAALLAALGICRVGVPGYEADDVIAQYSRSHIGGVDIVTGDRDLFQLVDDKRGVRVLYTAKGMGNLQLIDAARVESDYGVPPEFYADFAILRGDASDGLPGVAGVGDKTAARLIRDFGPATAILAAAADEATPLTPGLRRRLLEGTDYVRRADPVVRLAHELPVPPGPCPLPRRAADPDALAELAARYRVESPVSRLTAALAAAHSRNPE